jgi:hypothetical protein
MIVFILWTVCRWQAAPPPRRKGKRDGSDQSGEGRTVQEMQNSGNEAKKYLKTKDITFLIAANYARFEHKLTAI